MTNTAQFPPETIQAFVTGELDEPTAKLVSAAAESDTELAAEIAVWRAAREIHAERIAASHPTEFGWARIERAIDQSSAAKATIVQKPFWARQVIAPWQAAAGIALALFVWQAAIAPTIITAEAESEPEYVLAGTADSEGATLRIAFVETASESEMRTILREIDARIVDGPSALGFYTIAFPDEASLADAKVRLEQSAELIDEVLEQ
ncbi:MAG: hypothetical protein AAF494_14475 [Pseudomonadota bacterium]